MIENGNTKVVNKGAPKPVTAAKPRKAAAPKSAVQGKARLAAKGQPAVAEVVAAGEAVTERLTPPAQPADSIEAVTSPAIESDSTETLAFEHVEPAPQVEEMIDMVTVTSPTDAAEKAQAVFGDFSNRFKSAFEKSSKLGEEMVDFAKGNVEAVIASAKVAAQASESLGHEAAAYNKKNFETATQAFKSFTTVKSPTELFQLQSEFAKAQFDSMIAEASRVSEAMMKVAGDVSQPLSNRYALAAEKIKATAL